MKALGISLADRPMAKTAITSVQDDSYLSIIILVRTRLLTDGVQHSYRVPRTHHESVSSS
jgi:hypothetical protein